MSEREKMLAGEPYDASDPDLVAARVRARRLTQRLSALDPADSGVRAQLLRDLLGDLGTDSWVEAPFYCDYGAQVHLGARVYVNMGCVFLDAATITVHDDAQLGPCVQLLTSDHPRDAAQRAVGLESALPITIGARAWLGGGTIVLPGVEIGPDTIIGAGSVVTRSVQPGVVAVGNPCRVIPDTGSDAMRIEYLADHQALVPELARLHFAEWGHLHPEETLEDRTRRLLSCCGRGGVPTVLVALEGPVLCGSAMLIAHDMDTRPDLTPWLAGVYVLPSYRQRGYGSALVGRVVREAAALGVPRLHLYTPDASEFYTRLGWSVLDRGEYRGAQVAVMSKRTAAGA